MMGNGDSEPWQVYFEQRNSFFCGYSVWSAALAIEAVTSMSADNVASNSIVPSQVSVPKQPRLTWVLFQMQIQTSRFSYWRIYKNINAKLLALSIIIGNNKLNQSFESTQTKPITIIVEDENKDMEDPEDPTSTVSNSMCTMFSTSLPQIWKCIVIDMSIEDVEITNSMLAEAAAKGAVAVTELEGTRSKLVRSLYKRGTGDADPCTGQSR